MPAAQIQFSQGITTTPAGQSALGYVTGTQVNFTDAAGAGATWQWSIVGWPGPLGSAPTITNPTAQTANLTPTLDGVYIIKLVRTDPGPIVTTDVRFFAIGDADYGIVLPSAGMTGYMTNIGGSSIAQGAGWEGTASAGTNVFVDAAFRFLRGAIGRFKGLPQVVNFSAAPPSTVTIVDGVSKPWRILNLTGAGLYIEQLALTGPVPGVGRRFSYQVTISAGAGGFTLVNGVAGSTIVALLAPASGSRVYNLEVAFDGTNWRLLSNDITGGEVTGPPSASVVSGPFSTPSLAWNGTVSAASLGTNRAGATFSLKADLGITIITLAAAGMTLPGLAGSGAGLAGVDNTGLVSFKSFASVAGSITLGGDVTGAANANTTVAWRGKALDAATMGAPTDAQIPVWVNGSTAWKATSLTGDATISNAGVVNVGRINGATVPPAGALVTGNVLQVSGVSSLTYGPVGVGSISPGTAGQVFVTNATPAATWTSLISVETTHGRFTSGGGGTDAKVVIGPDVGAETTNAAVWLLLNATAASGTNYSLNGDGSSLYLNAPSGVGAVRLQAGASGLVDFVSASATLYMPSVLWIGSAVAPSISQAASSTAAGQPLTVAAQSTSFAGAAGGSLNLRYGASGAGGVPPQVIVGGPTADMEIRLGYPTNTTGFNALYFLPHATATGSANYTFLGDSSGNAYFNTWGTLMVFRIGNAGTPSALSLAASALTFGVPTVRFDATIAAAIIGTNAASATLSLQANAAETFASGGANSVFGNSVRQTFVDGATNIFVGANNTVPITLYGRPTLTMTGTLNTYQLIFTVGAGFTIQSNANVTSLTMGTNAAGASHVLQYGAATTGLTLGTGTFAGGGAVFAVPLVVASGGDAVVQAGVQITRAGTGIVLIGPYNGTDGAMWAGSSAASPSVSNYCFLSDGNSTWYNAPNGSLSGALHFYIGNSTHLGDWTTSAFTVASGGLTVTSLGGSGAGFATISNTGVFGFTSTVPASGVSPGTAGQVFITNATPAPVWTSLISVELTHGRFQAGGTGTDFKAVMGPHFGAETVYAALYLLGNATSPAAANYALAGDNTNLFINTAGVGGSVTFAVNGAANVALGSTGALAWANTQIPSLAQNAPSIVTAAGQNMTLAPQAGGATSGVPGALLFNIAAPNGGSAENFVKVQRGGTNYLMFGPLTTLATTFAAIYPGGVTPDGTNFLMYSALNGTNVGFNAATGGTIGFDIGGANFLTLVPTSGGIFTANVQQVSLGSASVYFQAAVASPTISQLTQTSNVANSDLTFAPQAPWNNVGNTFNKPGSLVVNLATPTNGATTEAAFIVKRAATTLMYVQQYPGLAGTTALVLNGGAVSAYTLYNDASNNTHISTVSGGAIYFENAGSQLSYQLGSGTGAWHLTSIKSLEWDSAMVAPIIHQLVAANNVAATDLTISAQGPGGGTSLNPGTLIFEIQKSLSANTFFGGVLVRQADAVTPTPMIRMGMYGGPSTTYAGIWFVDAGTPTSGNFGFLGNQSFTYLNVPSGGTGVLSVGGTAGQGLSWAFNGGTTYAMVWGASCTFVTMSQTAPLTDAATGNITVSPQPPNGGAVTHVDAGDFIVQTPASISGTTKMGGFLVEYGTTPMIRMGTIISSTVATAIWLLDGGSPTSLNWQFSYASGTLGYNAATQHSFEVGNVIKHIITVNGVQLFNNTANFGSGVGVLGISNATTAPTTNPTGGGILYADSGLLKWRDVTGIVTTLGGRMAYAWRDSAVSFTIDTTTNDHSVRLTATQNVNLANIAKGRELDFIMDATGVAIGSNMVITFVRVAAENINNIAASLVVSVPGGDVQGWRVKCDGTNWWIYPG